MKRGLVVISFLLGFFISANAWSFDHSHAAFTSLLKLHLKAKGAQSLVNYRAIKSDRRALDQYLASLSSVTKAQFNAWKADEQLAFLLNAYNAFTLALIVDHYPVDSIKKIGSLLTSAWKIAFFSLLEEKRHLDSIEHELIRDKHFTQFSPEPRIHFALVCASLGCPSLAAEAFQAKHLNAQLKARAQAFLGDGKKNRWEAKEKKLFLSAIFDWYGTDFNPTHGSFLAFIAPLLTSQTSEVELIKSGKVTIEYLDYDWGINQW